MKVTITFKDPDAVYDCLKRQIKNSIDEIQGLSEDERKELVEIRFDEASEKLDEFVQYGEYVRIMFDLDEGTAEVLKVT